MPLPIHDVDIPSSPPHLVQTQSWVYVCELARQVHCVPFHGSANKLVVMETRNHCRDREEKDRVKPYQLTNSNNFHLSSPQEKRKYFSSKHSHNKLHQYIKVLSVCRVCVSVVYVSFASYSAEKPWKAIKPYVHR